MVCLVKVQRVERIIFSIFNRFNLGASAPFGNVHKQLDITLGRSLVVGTPVY